MLYDVSLRGVLHLHSMIYLKKNYDAMRLCCYNICYVLVFIIEMNMKFR